MLYFVLGVACTVGIFISFKAFDVLKIDTLQAIVANYLFCIITGFIFLNDVAAFQQIQWGASWVKVGLVLGILFIGIFYLMALTAQKVSVAASSMATKISLIIPVIISLWFLNHSGRAFNFINYIGLLLVFVAITLASLRPKENPNPNKLVGWQSIALPFMVFVGSGTIDTLLNWVNTQLKQFPQSSQLQALFPILIFGVALCIGIAILIFQQKKLQGKSILGGAILGICNYFSVYFLLKTLDAFDNNGAFVYPNFNMSIIVISSLMALFIFKERLLRINKIGIFVSIIAILLISYQEIWTYLQQ